jgi:phage tail sheath gpL-like
MKAFSLYGAYEGANAMSKVMAGENITSADLQSIISGLASTVVAGKQFKNTIGDSKLASMLSKRVADATNATKRLKPTATIDGKKIELEDLDRVKGKPKSEVLEYIKETSKDQLGRELTDIESKDLLEKFGLSVNKGEYAGMR